MVEYNQIYDNTSIYYGAGNLILTCYVTYNHNTVTRNVNTSSIASAKGAGFYIGGSAGVSGANNIVWENISTINPDFFGSATVNHTNCSTVIPGQGNINEDPMFFEPLADDFSLLAVSPCIDAGNPLSPFDPDGTVTDMGAIFFDQTGGGMLVPYCPSDFTITHNNELLIATLDWVNPTQAVNLEPLTEFLGVRIYRNGEFIDEVTDVTMGEPYNYMDFTVPSTGWYEYELEPFNSYGGGYAADNAAWIGLDVPGYPGVVSATPDPGQELQCTLNWSAPSSGQHGAYWPASSWDGQIIYRNDELIAELLGTNTTYLDLNIPEEGFYAYSVSYFNTSGEGPQAYSPPVYIGSPEYEVVPYEWVEISGIGINTGVTGDDQTLGPFDIGFAFPWWDMNFESQIWVCSNGWLSFSSGQGAAYMNAAIPTSGSPNNLIAPYWDDLTPNANSEILYYHDTANERFIVEWLDVPHYSTGGTYTFELILYANGDIDFMFNNLTHGTANSATLGIENSNGSEGIQVTFNGSGPLNPVNEMGIRIYSVNDGQPDMAVTLTPAATPIQIPAGGGTFDYDISIDNIGATTAGFDAWIVATLPSGAPFEALYRAGMTMPVGGNIFRTMQQNVPEAAPAGNYVYTAYAGAYPSLVFAEDSFPFEKLTTGDGFNPDNTWNVYGWDGDFYGSNLPDKFAPLPAFPNPFNPETTICYDVPQAMNVQVIIYDIQGREVSRLADGYHAAGSYQNVFSADNLASGVYFVRMKARDFNDTQKLLLIK